MKESKLTIDFKFERLSDSLAFEKWKNEHLGASADEMIAQAKAHGSFEAQLGDGTTWKLTN